MIEYKRSTILDKYFLINVFECPIDILIFAAKLGLSNVTIENFRHNRNPNSLMLHIKTNNLTIEPKLKQFLTDFQITNLEFNDLKDIWDTQGCYAVFHESNELKFKATDLNEFSRYKALDNFKWNLEIAIPDSASDGWGQIASPDRNLIDKIEIHIQNINQNDKHKN